MSKPKVLVESTGPVAASSATLLSNEFIYLPLSCFTSTVACEGDGSSKRIQSKVFKDYQVCDFFEKVSKVYTGNDSQLSWLSSCPKSSTLFPAGSSAINRTAHLDGKIFARSLVLSGGIGDASSVRKNKRRLRAKQVQLSSGSTNKVQSRMVGQMSGRKRKRLCKNAGLPTIVSREPHRTTAYDRKEYSVGDALSSPHQACHLSNSSAFSGRVLLQNYHPCPSLATLHTLHSLWVSYVEKLAGPTLRKCLPEENKCGSSTDQVTSSTVVNDTCSAISLILSKNLEICGALITVLSCPSHCHYNGKTGIIVDETRNTWRMATLKVRKQRKADSSSASILFTDLKQCMVNTVGERNETDERKWSTNTDVGGPDTSSHSVENNTKTEIHVVIVPKKNAEIEFKVTIGEYKLGIVLKGNDMVY
jgi:RNase P/RNase MRP subunit p29